MSAPYTLLHTGPFAPEQVRLHVRPGLRTYSPELERRIEEAWAAAAASGLHLWDGPVYSLLGSGVSAAGTLACEVQQTSYKAFYGTNVCHSESITDRALLANSLACCCVCHTSDGHILLGRRSHTVAEDQGVWHIPGGNLDDLSAGHAAPFMQIRREVEEEAHVRAQHIERLVCMGMGRNNRSHKPEFLFFARLHLNADELRARLHMAEDANEHTTWLLLPVGEVQSFFATHEVAGIGQAALALWEQLRGAL